MNTRGLMDKLLQSGNQFLQQQTGGKGIDSSQVSQFLTGAGGGALAGTAVGLLLGNKKARKIGGSVLKYGGVAALGAVAFKAYQSWQQNQAGAPQQTPQTVDRLPAPEAEQHSQSILIAMLGAAKADGHIDDRERQLIDDQVAGLTTDTELKLWLDNELKKPVNPGEIAQHAKTPEMAAEMYLASLLMVDEESFMEKAYLDELARQLKIDDALKAEIHAAKNQALT
ncbi:MAG: tellurite resistance TerB family protein [Methylophaga sp.]|nr:tellurite resistance TerB family protein [Methylophaga sp.]